MEHVSTPVAKLNRLESLLAQTGIAVLEVAPLLASLLSIPSGDRYAPLNHSPERLKFTKQNCIACVAHFCCNLR